MLNKKPIIGITTDYQDKDHCYSTFPWFALRRNYVQSIEQFGCTPIILPITDIEPDLDFIDAIIISGGDFDIDPKYFGQSITSSRVKINANRTVYEFKIIDHFIKNKKPILGICGGAQLINVFFKGSLIQDINSKIQHEQLNPRNETSHEIKLTNDSLLKKLTPKKPIFVNSAHHQAVDSIGENLIIDAYANDGIIEAFHHSKLPYCVGVQWHPEFLITDFDFNIMKDFVEHAKNYA